MCSIVKLQLSLLVQFSSNYSSPLEINRNTTIQVGLYTHSRVYLDENHQNLRGGVFGSLSVFQLFFWCQMEAAPEYFSQRQPAKASNAMLIREKIRFTNTRRDLFKVEIKGLMSNLLFNYEQQVQKLPTKTQKKEPTLNYWSVKKEKEKEKGRRSSSNSTTTPCNNKTED
jgi:hypothetical protein